MLLAAAAAPAATVLPVTLDPTAITGEHGHRRAPQGREKERNGTAGQKRWGRRSPTGGLRPWRRGAVHGGGGEAVRQENRARWGGGLRPVGAGGGSG